MIEILKQLFGEVSDDNLAKFNKALGEKFVAKTDFNAKLEEIKNLKGQLTERDGQLEKFKNDTTASEELKKTIETLQKNNKISEDNFKKQLAEKTLSAAIENALLRVKAVDPDLVKVKLNMENIKLDDSGKLTGLDEQIPDIKKNYGFLFEGENQSGYQPTGGKTPDPAPETLGGAIAEFYKQN